VNAVAGISGPMGYRMVITEAEVTKWKLRWVI